ncbi:flagellar biosynthetic protein FliR [Alteriqipengyuania lutimaris]|uniref:Flagellar biosynthetic protein FliR n=1 Tax=Alteriqipengyuania lutimaris TaxID=1538146 RepID=A0A395LPL0_9SPHN|nr:flagellar biosynthetic protein FliR [Alteriqipengyuania lutimaris]MBB3032487.1 flagellar biosynthetic protein FliR [Alteriqipengyuania lutimaris]RDS78377.1 flagellar biosynthetic protein FliR [Alteriqipengyuania lutimaris]
MLEDLPAQVSGFLVLFARLGGVMMVLPVFSDDAVPGRIRLLIAAGVSLALYGMLGPQVPASEDNVALAALILMELLVGLALGTVVRIMFLAITIAGSIISLQTGLTSAVMPDAALGGQLPVMAKLVSVAAAVVCLSLGIHHLWIAAMVNSYQVFPVGGLPPAADFAQLAIATTTRSMELGFSLAAPLVVYGIVFNVALGLAARLAPTIQVFFIAQPLNILLGLALFAATLGAVLTGFAMAMTDWLQQGWV